MKLLRYILYCRVIYISNYKKKIKRDRDRKKYTETWGMNK